MKPTVIATIVCLIAAVSEALVTGSDPRSRAGAAGAGTGHDFLGRLFRYRGEAFRSRFWQNYRSGLRRTRRQISERTCLDVACTAVKLSRIPSVWDARRCVNGSNDSDLRIRRCIAKRILRLSRLCSVLELSIMAAQRSETLTKQEVEVMSLCLHTLCNSAVD